MKEITYPIKTENLNLTPFTKEHGEDLYTLKLLPETHRYNYSSVPSRKDFDKYLKTLIKYDYLSPSGRLELAIIHRKETRLIGFIGFKGGDRYKKDYTAEIYYSLHRDYFGRGLGTEAVIGMLDFGFNTLELHRIWAGATCKNTASWKIMEKVGMRRECHWLKDRPMPGAWVAGKGYEKTDQWEDGYGYAILRDEFNAPHTKQK